MTCLLSLGWEIEVEKFVVDVIVDWQENTKDDSLHLMVCVSVCVCVCVHQHVHAYVCKLACMHL